MKIIKQVFLASILLIGTQSIAQNIKEIKGVIMDNKTNEPLAFVSVADSKTHKGTSTDFSGSFILTSENLIDSITISCIGYEKMTIKAQENIALFLKKSAVSLNEFVVSSDRGLEKRTEAPIAISSISAQTIADNKPTSIDQVLNQTAGVYMVDLGNEQHTMSIRQPINYGATYLYLEDGVPIRSSGIFNHNALLEINMANTSKVEIIRGPASSLYGSEAIGGAVNFISYRPSTLPTTGISLQGNNLGYKRTDFYASNTFKKLGVRLAGYYANNKDGFIEHSDFNKIALSLALNYQLSNKTEISINNTFVDYYADMTGSLDSADFFDKEYGSNHTFTNRQVDAFRSKLSIHQYWNTNSKSSLIAYYRNNSIKQNPSYRVKDDFKPWMPSGMQGDPNLAHGELNDNSFNSYGAILQHKQSFKFLKTKITAGGTMDYSPNKYIANYLTIVKNDEDIYESFEKQDSLLAEYTTDLVNTAGYFQFSIEPLKKLKLTGGIRYDVFTYNYKNNLDSNAFSGVPDSKDEYSQLTPKAGLSYDIGGNSGFYANYSQGFVPPQVTELYKGVQVPSLQPAQYNNSELGFWMASANNKAKIEVAFYQMDGTNEIISVRLDDGSTEKQNAGQTRHKGIEYTLHYQLNKGLTLKLNGTNAQHTFIDYIESGTDYSSKSMTGAPGWIANVQLTYKPHFLKGFRISGEIQHLDQFFMDAANTKEYEGYDIYNIRLGYEWKGFEIWANIMNVTEELYATSASSSRWGDSYRTGNPRHVTIGIGYNFVKKKKSN
ncbi:MAG: TonB-dependent receptor [Flavobacteriales bacterium]|nr:MAG: TonB-dependent receptor [Flavobacteriales bacterium]